MRDPLYDFAVLRELRKRDNLSLVQMADRAGVSVAVLSKLERNQSQPSLETLFRVGRVFGMHPSDVLRLAESRGADRQEERSRTSGGFAFREVVYGNVRCLLGEGRAGAEVSRPHIHGDDHEVCWVLSGRLRFRLPTETVDLNPGESIQFDAVLKHTYQALADVQFLLLRVRKPPAWRAAT